MMTGIEELDPVIPGYRIEHRVGSGGSGVVYRAHDQQRDATVAVKVLKARDAVQTLHMKSEFRILSGLDHPCLARVHDFGYFPDGRAWFVMDWVDGEALSPAHVRASDGSFDAMRFTELVADISAALEYIHSQHVIHGDLKPENILISIGENGLAVRIMDFGLSIPSGSLREGLSGTLAYMPPEIIRGESAGEASDLYALGCVLFETVSGHPPYIADSPVALLRMHLDADTPPLPADVPPELAGWIRTLMEKQPQLRFRTAFQLHKAASDVLGRTPQLQGHESLRGIRLPDIPREQEWARIAELRSEAMKRPVVLCISGPEGSGVSRLLRSIATELQFEGVHLFRAVSTADSGSFAPVLNIVAALSASHPAAGEDPRFGIIAAAFPEALPDVEAADLPELTPESARIRVFHAAAELLVDAGAPSALVLDVADQVDSFTLEFLEFLASYLDTIEDRGFLLLLGADETRMDALEYLAGTPLWKVIHLAPVSRQETTAALQALFGSVSPSFIDVIQRQSKGLPGRMEDLLNYCEAEGILEATGHGWLIHERDNLGEIFPSTLAQTYQRAIQRLDDETRRILDCITAAVIPLAPEAIEYATGLAHEAIRAGISKLQRTRLIDTIDGGYFPAHPAVRSAIPKADNTAHRAMYDWYMEHPPGRDTSVVLGRHALGAGLRDEAMPLLLAAASEREIRFDYAGAVTLLRDALPLSTGSADRRFDILDALARLCNILGRREDEQEYLEEMLLLAARGNSPSNLAKVYKNQTEYYLANGEYDRARRSTEKALGQCIETGDIAGQAFCHQKLGMIEYRTHPGEAVLRHYERARELYATSGAAIDEGNIIVDIGLVYYSILEAPEKALDCFNQAREIFERIDNPRGLTRVFGNIGMQYFYLGRYEESLAYHARANELAKASGDRRLVAISCGSMGQCEIAICRYSPAVLHLQEELRIARELNDQYLIGKCFQNLGTLYLTLGAFDAAVDALTEAQRIAAAAGDQVGQASAANDIAMCHIERRDFDNAQKQIVRAEQMLGEAQDVNVAAMLLYRQGILMLARGEAVDFEKAMHLFGKLGDLADKHGFDSHSILARSYSAMAQLRLGRAAVALDLSTEAMQLLAGHGVLHGGSHDILFNHAQVLRANKMLAESTEMIELAHAELMRGAESISDPQLYRSYLEQVRTNAGIVREFALTHRSDALGSLTAVREQNLRTLYEVARKINSVLDLNALLDSIMDSALEAMNGERGMIFLIEDDQLSLKVSRNVEKETIRDATEISLSILRDVLHGGKPIIVSDTSQDESFSRRDSVVNFNIHSLICVPMRLKEKVIGTVYVDSRSDAVSAMSFSEIDAEFLEAFANLATIAIENARLHLKLKQENLYLRREVQQRFGFESVVGGSAPMLRLFSETQVAIKSEGSVLIYGESGTGKELIAKAIHYNGSRKDHRFVAVDCGALPDTLLESELFGYKRGAFTGAVADKAGLFEEADNGTLFLDEISNTSLAFQAKLLRVLQEGEFRRVGDPGIRMVNVRIICATNTDLQEEIAKSNFRQDLFYRLNVIPITIPPLRERLVDIPELVQHFIAKYNQHHPSAVSGASSELVEHLQRLPWKGNVRELENLINRLIAQGNEAVLTTKMLPQEYATAGKDGDTQGTGELGVSLRAPQRLMTLVDLEKEHISFVLKHSDGNKTEAARILGLKRTTLVEKMKKLGMM